MKWENTIKKMDWEDYDTHNQRWKIDKMLAEQVEITWDIAFKAGYDKRDSELVYNPDYLDFKKGVKSGKDLGMREVVEWMIKEQDVPVRYAHNATCYDCIERLKANLKECEL